MYRSNISPVKGFRFCTVSDAVEDKLKEHLIEERDYTLVPEEGWVKLIEWYGMAPGSRPIARKVVEFGFYMKHLKVEVHLLEFKLIVYPNLTEHTIRAFSRGDSVGKYTDNTSVPLLLHTINGMDKLSGPLTSILLSPEADLEATLRRVYSIPADTPCRVWHRYMSDTYYLLSDPSQTLQDTGLYNMQVYVNI